METMLIDARAVAQGVEQVRQRIEHVCERAGRSSEDVTLVAVSKTFPLAAVDAARAVGLRDFGENKVQELVEKAAFRPGRERGGALAWHMIGHLQTNKVDDVVQAADVFHGLDSVRLARELDRSCAEAGRVLTCFVQVNVAREESKYGLDPDDLYPVLDELVRFEHLDVVGLMGMAPYADDPEASRPHFVRLRELAEAYDALPLRCLSMGMSGDFEVAIEEGATHVRVGSAIFGARHYG